MAITCVTGVNGLKAYTQEQVEMVNAYQVSQEELDKSLTPLEEQLVIELVADMAYEVLAEYSENMSTTKEINGLFQELFLGTEDNAFQDEILDKLKELYNFYPSIEKKIKLGKVLQLINPNGNPTTNPFILDVLKQFSNRGFGMSFDKIEQADETSPEAWQVTVNTIDTFSKLGKKLKLQLSNLTKMELVNDELQPQLGFLDNQSLYPLAQVHATLIHKLGNSPHHLLYDQRIKDNMSDPIVRQLFGDLSTAEAKELKTDIYNKIAQNVKYDYVDSVIFEVEERDELGEDIKKSVSFSASANERTFKNVIAKQIRTNVLAKGKLIKNGKYVKHKLNAFGKQMTHAERVALAKSFGLVDASVNIPEKSDFVFESVINNVVEKVMKDKDFDIFAITDKPINSKELESLADFLTNYQDNNINLTHRNAKGETVYEFNRPSFISKFVLSFQNLASDVRDKVYSGLLNDRFYKDSLLISDLKKGLVDVKILNSIKTKGENQATEYSSMNERLLAIQQLMMFDHGGSNSFIITNPVQSDAGIQTGLQINKKAFNAEQGYAALVQLAKRERMRVNKPNSLQAKNGHTFFPYLDGKPIAEFDKLIRKNVPNQYEAYREDLMDLGIIEENEIGELVFTDGMFPKHTADNFLRQYFINYLAYEADIIWTLDGDPSYYGMIDYAKPTGKGKLGDGTKYNNGGVEAVAKRAKQVWSPLTYSLVGAEWTNSKGESFTVREDFRTMIMGDVETFTQDFIDYLKEFSPKHVSKYSNVSLTDAQSYIDLIRFKEQSIGLEGWSQLQEDVLTELLSGEMNLDADAFAKKYGHDKRDLKNVKFGSQKPFYYSFMERTEGDNTFVHPFQNKDSEFIALPYMALETLKSGQTNPLFNPLFKWMLEQQGYKITSDTITPPSQKERFTTANAIDKFTFDTAVKVGHNNEDSANVTSIADNKEGDIETKERSVVTMDMGSYGKQGEVPFHAFDDEQKMAVQVRKNIVKDIKATTEYNVRGEMMTGTEIVDEMNALEIDNINEDLAKINKRFDNPKEIINMLRDEILRRDLDSRYLELLQLDADGNYIMPLDHPAFIYTIRQVVNAVYTKGVITQKLTNGVAYANVSPAGFDPPKVKTTADGGIEYYEAYAPINNSVLQQFIKPNEVLTEEVLRERTKGIISDEDFDKLVNGIVWRIPNEKPFSIFHIKVTKFFSSESGGGLVLPPELTEISGFDFDIDKVYGFFYNYSYKYDIASIVAGLNDSHKEALEAAYPGQSLKSIIKSAISGGSYETRDAEGNVTETRDYKELMELIEESGITKQITINTEGKKGRHNEMMDLYHAIMQHERTASEILKSSSFSNIQKIRDSIANILGVGSSPMQLNLPQTNYKIADRMLTGKQLIGPLANINSIVALLQKSNVEFTIPMVFNNVTYSKLNMIKYNGIQPSDTIGNWVAAIVDNGKDPLAGDLNVNWATIDVLIGMLSTGVDMDTALMFLNEREIRDYAKTYLYGGANLQAETKAIAKYLGVADPNSLDKQDRERIRKFRSLDNLRSSQEPYTTNDKLNTKDVLPTFLLYAKMGNDLKILVNGLKVAESGLGSSAGHTQVKLEAVEEAAQLSQKENALLTNTDFVYQKGFVHSALINAVDQGNKTIIAKMNLSDTQNVNGLYWSVLEQMQAIKKDSGMNLTKVERDHIMHNLRHYISSQWLPYMPELTNNFPQEFISFKANNPEYNELFNAFYVEDNQLVYQGVNTEISKARERYYKLIKSLLNGTEEQQFFAYKLGVYTFYIDGFGASQTGYSHILPLDWYKKHANIPTSQLNDIGQEQTSIFIKQYFRNFPDTTWIPVLDGKNKVIYSPVYKNKDGKLIATNNKGDFKVSAELGVTKKGAINSIGGKVIHAYQYGENHFNDQSYAVYAEKYQEQLKEKELSVIDAYNYNKNNKGGSSKTLKECNS